MRGYLAVALCLGLASLPSAGRADVVESFLAPRTAADGTQLGACQQLTVRSAGGGNIAIAGNGAATVETPLSSAAAIIHSSVALPAAGYSVSVTVSRISYGRNLPGGGENGVTLLAIADAPPAPASSTWWATHRLFAIEVDSLPDSPDPYPLYVSYWSPTEVHTWDGTQWGPGATSWKPIMSCDPAKRYTLELERANGWYTATVRSGGLALIQAKVPVSSVKPSAVEYLVVGDRLTDRFHGTLDVNSISLPTPSGCNLPIDAGPPSDLRPESCVLPDAAPEARDASVELDHKATERLLSWDLFTPDVRTPPGGPTPASGCSCQLLREAEGASPLGLLLLGGLSILRRARDRARSS